jgi:hypothetical protein
MPPSDPLAAARGRQDAALAEAVAAHREAVGPANALHGEAIDMERQVRAVLADTAARLRAVRRGLAAARRSRRRARLGLRLTAARGRLTVLGLRLHLALLWLLYRRWRIAAALAATGLVAVLIVFAGEIASGLGAAVAALQGLAEGGP